MLKIARLLHQVHSEQRPRSGVHNPQAQVSSVRNPINLHQLVSLVEEPRTPVGLVHLGSNPISQIQRNQELEFLVVARRSVLSHSSSRSSNHSRSNHSNRNSHNNSSNNPALSVLLGSSHNNNNRAVEFLAAARLLETLRTNQASALQARSEPVRLHFSPIDRCLYSLFIV